jgi:hypothetical protein
MAAEPAQRPRRRGPRAAREETPHLARSARHPLPMGEGGNWAFALSPGERVDCDRRFHQPARAG